jgi:hypothetical protein
MTKLLMIVLTAISFGAFAADKPVETAKPAAAVKAEAAPAKVDVHAKTQKAAKKKVNEEHTK